jgi:hypothetical protein
MYCFLSCITFTVAGTFCWAVLVCVCIYGEFDHLQITLDFGSICFQSTSSNEFAFALCIHRLYFTVEMMIGGHCCDEKLQVKNSDLIGLGVVV